MTPVSPTPPSQSPARTSSPSPSTISSDSAAKRIAANVIEAPKTPGAWGTWLRDYRLGTWSAQVARETSQDSPEPASNANGSASPGASVTTFAPVKRSTAAKLNQPTKLSKSHRYVKVDSNSIVESMEFFEKNGWLAAPHLPHRQQRRVAEALRRHGFSEPQERDVLNLYLKHAKAVFKCEYASFMVEAPDDAFMLILAQDGGDPEVQIVPRTVTMCSHAMLLPDDEVLVVSNTNKDWRFRSCPSTLAGTVTNAKGKPMNFYASAPLFLSYSLNGIEGRVQVGRLCIMDEQPRSDFDERAADLLFSIGQMAGDALENEYQAIKIAKAAEMQQRTSSLVRLLEDAALNVHLPHKTSSSSSNSADAQDSGYSRYSLVVLERACQEIRECFGAAAVAVFDVSNFRLRRQAFQFVSTRNSTAPSDLTPNGVPPRHVLEQQQLEAALSAPSELAPASEFFDDVVPDSRSISPRLSRTASAQPDDVFDAIDLREGSPSPTVLSFDGPEEYQPNMIQEIDRLKSIFAPPLARLASDTDMNARCRFYVRSNNSATESEDGSEGDFSISSAGAAENKDPWADLLPQDATVGSYAVCATYDRARARPGIMFLVMFDRVACFEQQERFFIESSTQISLSSLLRQKLYEVDYFQAEFLRHVQHNLRTPLHGALGAVEYLRAAISSDDDGLKVDLSADGVLATLLESITLSGQTLNSYIDDLLSFQQLSGIKAGAAHPVKRVPADMVKLIESVADEEWEFAQRLDLQSRSLEANTFQAEEGPLGGVELIVKASPEVRDYEWHIDVKMLQDLVRKVVSNAIRFTRKGYVEITMQTAAPGTIDDIKMDESDDSAILTIEVADTGVGMTKDFCTNQLLQPFAKGDSFRDGIGLGMAIVASVLESRGGRLLVASEVGVGTRITMCMSIQRGSRLNDRPAPTSGMTSPEVPVSKLAFYGFETRGLRRIAKTICNHFISIGGIQPSFEYAEADCIVMPARAVSTIDQDGNSLLSQVKPDVRFVVISSSHLIKENGIQKLDWRAVLPLPLPLGPSSLRLMETFLFEDDPMLIHIANPALTNAQNRASVAEQGSSDSGSRRNQEHRRSTSDAVRHWIGESKGSQLPEVSEVDGVADLAAQLAEKAEIAPVRMTPPRIDTDKTLVDDEFRVLVVEDNPINMRLLTTLCKRLDIKYEEACDGAEAVAKFIAFRPSVVLLDISLPIQDGFAACSQMRTHNHPSFIVAVTALSSEEDKTRGIEICGMDAWMTKPVSPRQVKADLEGWRRKFEQSKAEAIISGLSSASSLASQA